MKGRSVVMQPRVLEATPTRMERVENEIRLLSNSLREMRVMEATPTRMARVENEIRTLSGSLQEMKLLLQQFEEMQVFVSKTIPDLPEATGPQRIANEGLHLHGVGLRGQQRYDRGYGFAMPGRDMTDAELRALVAQEKALLSGRLEALRREVADVKYVADKAMEAGTCSTHLAEATAHQLTEAQARFEVGLEAVRSDVVSLKAITDVPYGTHSLADQLKEAKARSEEDLDDVRSELAKLKKIAEGSPDTHRLADQLREVMQEVLPRVIEHEESIEKELAEAKRAIEDARSAAEADSRELVKRLSLHLGSVEGLVARGQFTKTPALPFSPITDELMLAGVQRVAPLPARGDGPESGPGPAGSGASGSSPGRPVQGLALSRCESDYTSDHRAADAREWAARRPQARTTQPPKRCDFPASICPFPCAPTNLQKC